MDEKTREMLEKQLELLSEQSQHTSDICELARAANAMAELAETLK